MLNPKIFCRRHLIAQHSECHTCLGILNRKIKIDGFIKSNCMEIMSIQSYHEICVEEMISRKYNHNTPIPLTSNDVLEFYKDYLHITVDREKALNLLLLRCYDCKIRYEEILKMDVIEKEINIDEKILNQDNQRCDKCEAPEGTRCESNPSNCPYQKIDIDIN